MLTVLAPAKLNLSLEVLSRRTDGYHEIRSVMQTISLCDCLKFQPKPAITFKSDMPEWALNKSLVSKTVRLIQKTTGSSKGVEIEVAKRIPLLSGLGGDSSDAATTLLGLNMLWELGLSQGRLLELAAELGSDVSFFLYGGTAMAAGRGEMVNPLPPLPQKWIILLMPNIPQIPNKTRQLYASLKASHFTDGQITQRLTAALKEGQPLPSPFPFNTFENVAFSRFAKLKVYKEHLLKLGADNVHLAGAGPALFTLLEDKSKAEDLYIRCQQQGLETYLAETIGGREGLGIQPLYMS